MLCTCFPAQAFAASGVPEGCTPVYTLEDIYKATDRSSAVKLFLMNDIDADTVIAVPLRGGGYGGEWGSNFNLTMRNYYGNHVGFQRAANGMRSALADYLTQLKAEGKLKGEVKFWFTGYSRASATANLVAHDVSALSSLGGILKKLLSNGLNSSGVARAHHPELYLARLETGGLNTVEDFVSHARSKQVVVPLLKTIPGVTGGSASGHLGIFIYDSKDQLADSYEDGVCKSGTATVEQTDAGVVFTLPDGDEEYTLSVGSRSDGKFSFSVFSYDEESLSEPARTVDFTDFPMEAGTVFAYTIPAGTDGEYRGYSEDGTDQYDPDYDSLTDGDDRPLDGGVSMNFTDVPTGAYFYDAVKWAVEEEITSGTSAVSFSPYAACTRAQVITFLWRAAGCPEPESGANPFVGVPSNAYYRDVVQWAVEEGITSGTSPSRFSPNATVTRDQTVTFLWRWDGCPDAETRSGFRDVPAGAYYADAVSWAVEQEITKGTSAATFSPSQTCTRA